MLLKQKGFSGGTAGGSVALAIVCDEFFVPALECIVDTAGISDDVGACFFFSSSFFINFFFNLVLDRG